jgi:FkbH-like protein
MYESYNGGLKADTTARVPPPADAAKPSGSIRSLLVWGEHCTECAMPACYAACDLYNPRQDLHCSRFNGNVRVKATDDGEDWILVRFGKWARLQASPVGMFEAPRLRRLERLDGVLSAAISRLPARHGFKARLANFWTRNKSSVYGRLATASIAVANRFTAQTFNPSDRVIGLTLSIRDKSNPARFCEWRMLVKPGVSEVSIDVGSFTAQFGPAAQFWVALTPDAGEENIDLYFRNLGFAAADAPAAAPAPAPAAAAATERKKAKCVVWDLDNTLWDGTLIEMGLDRLRLREGVVAVIKSLDERGILHSIASKNPAEDALQALRRFGLEEYFLHPQISWWPKSRAIDEISRRLNIGRDTIVFVDDQPFERAEVSSAFPDVEVFADDKAAALPLMARFDVPVTDESRQRRSYYRDEISRTVAESSYDGDYLGFLRSCAIELSIWPLTEAQVDRVYELAQRTNQMNFSGNRYSKADLRAILPQPDKKTFVMSCRDRFGEYGLIGFAVVTASSRSLDDLMFSCRVQAKQVEHAFIRYVARSFRKAGQHEFFARYRRTERNAPAGKVFTDLGFTEVGMEGDAQILRLDLDRAALEEPLVQLRTSHDE